MERWSSGDLHGKMPIKDTRKRIFLFLTGENLSFSSIFLSNSWRSGVSSSGRGTVMEKSRQGKKECVESWI